MRLPSNVMAETGIEARKWYHLWLIDAEGPSTSNSHCEWVGAAFSRDVQRLMLPHPPIAAGCRSHRHRFAPLTIGR